MLQIAADVLLLYFVNCCNLICLLFVIQGEPAADAPGAEERDLRVRGPGEVRGVVALHGAARAPPPPPRRVCRPPLPEVLLRPERGQRQDGGQGGQAVPGHPELARQEALGAGEAVPGRGAAAGGAAPAGPRPAAPHPRPPPRPRPPAAPGGGAQRRGENNLSKRRIVHETLLYLDFVRRGGGHPPGEARQQV